MNQPDYKTKASSGSTWCGPYAFAILTGRTYDQADKWLRKLLNRKQKIQGIYWDEASFVAEKLKWKKLKKVRNMTFNQLRDNLLSNRWYLVAYTSHFVVVDTRTWRVIDNNGQRWTDYNRWSKRNKIKHVWQTTVRQKQDMTFGGLIDL